jgi:hypothetical protein
MKIARALTGKGLREYAAFIGLHSATYCRIENAMGCDVSTLIKIHDKTGISYDLLLSGNTRAGEGK